MSAGGQSSRPAASNSSRYLRSAQKAARHRLRPSSSYLLRMSPRMRFSRRACGNGRQFPQSTRTMLGGVSSWACSQSGSRVPETRNYSMKSTSGLDFGVARSGGRSSKNANCRSSALAMRRRWAASRCPSIAHPLAIPTIDQIGEEQCRRGSNAGWLIVAADVVG
jgi:hypothetical protein